jgi:hypothetical protein
MASKVLSYTTRSNFLPQTLNALYMECLKPSRETCSDAYDELPQVLEASFAELYVSKLHLALASRSCRKTICTQNARWKERNSFKYLSFDYALIVSRNFLLLILALAPIHHLESHSLCTFKKQRAEFNNRFSCIWIQFAHENILLAFTICTNPSRRMSVSFAARRRDLRL